MCVCVHGKVAVLRTLFLGWTPLKGVTVIISLSSMVIKQTLAYDEVMYLVFF